MSIRFGLGPVFAGECVTSARRWQVYAARALLVTSLLVGLTLVWLTRVRARPISTHQEIAAIGNAFADAILAVELVLALVLVPAATAGVVCQDKMRGGLTLMMVTDLSDAEIVLGKLASRLAAVLGVVACSLPVLALSTILGGVDALIILRGSFVIVGVSVLGVSVALTFSVWATKAHEALTATYATWAVWLLALLGWSETSRGGTPQFLYHTNPFWLLFGWSWFASNAQAVLMPGIAFLGGCLVVALLLALLATWRIRAVTLGHASRTVAKTVAEPRWAKWGRERIRLRRTSLDEDPIRWRESRRRNASIWARAIWSIYFFISAIFTIVIIFGNGWVAAGVSGFMVSIGLLFVSVTSATALAEERALGSLDILLATPLSSRTIFLGKWWGAFRAVPGLAILPAIVGGGSVCVRGHCLEAVPFTILTIGLVVTYGAVVTSVGLAFATWQRRLGRAVALSVAVFVTATVIYPTIALMVNPSGPSLGAHLWISPFFGMYISVAETLQSRTTILEGAGFAMTSWVFLNLVVAGVLRWATVACFDRCLGRVADHTDRSAIASWRAPIAVKSVGTTASLRR